ncbi:unnamed protein product [Cylicocyclus nassatus]|uniref:Uncharacterized protein n=1 Tax=Cylicocyclus nassatus TaxID=53992 RepID=A0AA36M204_CYLNA|nr:unnamed protein product [Cylicocyclus nassatus]
MDGGTKEGGEETTLQKDDAETKGAENISEKEDDDTVEDDLASIASSDLAMADEASDDSDEENVTADMVDDIVTETFDPYAFTPLPMKHIVPLWVKHPPEKCDDKNWEIFMEALEAFDQDTLHEGKDDFIVTIETLCPHLSACFATLTKDSPVTEKDVCSRIIVWLEVCLGKGVQASGETKKLNDIALKILKAVMSAPKGIGTGLIEAGLIELLIEVAQDLRYLDIQARLLRNLFLLISSPLTWREAISRLAETNNEESHDTVYSKLIAISLGSFPSKNTLPLITLIAAWSRFATSVNRLELSAKDLFSAISRATQLSEVSVDDFYEKWDEFVKSLDILRDYIIEFHDERTCVTFDVYALLDTTDILDICCKLLKLSQIVDKWPNVLKFIRSLLDDKYYGMLFIACHPGLGTLLEELRKVSEKEKVKEALVDGDMFDEGVWQLETEFPTATDVYMTVVYRLHALYLIDDLKDSIGTLRLDIDDDNLVKTLTSICNLCNVSEKARKEVLWVLSQKYLYHIVDIITHAKTNIDVRNMSCYALATHLMAIVLAEVDDHRFWLKYSKIFSKLITDRCITYNDNRKLHEYLAPLTSYIFQYVGQNDPGLVKGLFRKMCAFMQHRHEVNTGATGFVRALEAEIMHANEMSRLERYHTLEREGAFEKLASWLFEFVQYRHVMWQMGEPVSCEDSRLFLDFAFPVLRIHAGYFRTCSRFVGQPSERIKMKSAEDQSRRIVKLRPMSDTLLDAVFLMWSCAGGMNGQAYSEDCKKIRLAVLDVLKPSLCFEHSLTSIIRHIIFRSCSRPHFFPGLLSLLLTLAPSTAPLTVLKRDLPSFKNVIIDHRQRVKTFVNAFVSCDNRAEIAELLLSPNSYVSELSFAFVERMANMDYRITWDIISILLNYVATSVELFNNVREPKGTPATQSSEDDLKKPEAHNSHASTGLVRMMESFQNLCTIHAFRLVLYDFLSRSRDGLRLLTPILNQFEKPTLESERQLRFQTAALEVLSGFLAPTLWAKERPSLEICSLYDFIEFPVANDDPVEEVFCKRKKEEKSSLVSGPPDDAEKPIKVEEDSPEIIEVDPPPPRTPSCLETVLLSFLRFINDAEQKLSLVQRALMILKDATSEVPQENMVFVDVLTYCLVEVGLLGFFKRLEAVFDNGEAMTCLSAVVAILDKTVGDKTNLLRKVLAFTSSEHPMVSIIAHLNELDDADENTKIVLKTLDKFFRQLNEESSSPRADPRRCRPVSQIHGRVLVELCKRNLYSKPLLLAVDGIEKARENTKAASRILVHRKETVGTRMGSDVAKMIETHKGKEKAVRNIIREQLKYAESEESASPQKRMRSSSKN